MGTKEITVKIKKIGENVELTNDLGLRLKFPKEAADILLQTAISYSVLSKFNRECYFGKNFKLTLTIEEI